MIMPSDRKAAAKLIAGESEIDASIDNDEPTTKELVEMLRESVHQANAGNTRPASEVMRELREMLAEDGNAN